LGLLLWLVVLEANCPQRLGGAALMLKTAKEIKENLSIL
jgi:hypothetical protein